jgi:hypothetical protein
MDGADLGSVPLAGVLLFFLVLEFGGVPEPIMRRLSSRRIPVKTCSIVATWRGVLRYVHRPIAITSAKVSGSA